ncbi:tryptophan-rich sensory protein [Luteococcus japonicus]|uniref:tryptophan-rich sensory protein n=1 Tax=Luteococcus japonicus TaxID=33984 RepID=UPI000B9AD70B|nr:tryptophan-rich sensory protein [Luteococcus japonicus]
MTQARLGMVTRVGMVTGASGYVGGQVVERLLDNGWDVRVLARDPRKLPEWGERVHVVQGDASDDGALREAMHGAEAAWFLIHSMGSEEDFAEQDRHIATTFAHAAKDEQVGRLVYLGGLHPEGEELSPHLASRVEVGEILMASGVPTAAIQAGVVLGDGSASFDMLRCLSERLPGSVGPRWLDNTIQPIHVDDVVHYLVAAADLPAEQNRTFDVGGPDVLTYAEMMDRYARVQHMGPRPSITAPVWTPRLASYWISLVTPIEAAMARPLIESLHHDTVVAERDLDELVGPPPGGTRTFEQAVQLASGGHDQYRFAKVLAATSAAVGATAALGAVATIPNTGWFKRLDTPAWQPSNALFGPVWTALYADITVISALHLTDLMEQDRTDEARRFAAALGPNLVLNSLWCWVFWRGRTRGPAAVVAAALAASSTDLVRRVGKRRERGVLLCPYAAWTTFATGLAAELWRRNR